MREIGIGVVGGGYMGKAHSVAFAAVASVFELPIRPRLAAICGSTPDSSVRYAAAYGFARAASDWRALVADDSVEAVVIASPQSTHREIALEALARGKPVLCEKPMGLTVAEAQDMVDAARGAKVANMVAYNYSRTPATQFARRLIAEGRLGRLIHARIEHTEDFHIDGILPPWRCQGAANGCLGDLAPHPINAALALMGPIEAVSARIETVFPERNGHPVTNDDQVQMMLRFAGGVSGSLFASRVATGRKMGFTYEITGELGALRFDQEDQNALWFYETAAPPAERGFRKILTGPDHPDYKPFCLGPGHGTGYQDQIIIEAKDFLTAIHEGRAIWPTFEDGLAVHRVIAAARQSHAKGGWVAVDQVGISG
ncbi:Gfo/Idh/MocA family protein [Thetidibacter halocola]|uniref:Gfo/Idh/MocA family oxidoreductase n=1 Tax=Thetidibacter halocola TaxID=2827239 RepID=A0A8J7WEH4_9RHOB|nr:Gfo/Idh/MocA family oxidoreductase [Thetidibacter halocola]MBS0126142.1 Gfo/Idh/MocA family oxidoreductase [Thetidibacter halocola]